MEKIYTKKEIINAINHVHCYIEWYEKHRELDILETTYLDWLNKAIEIIEQSLKQK